MLIDDIRKREMGVFEIFAMARSVYKANISAIIRVAVFIGFPINILLSFVAVAVSNLGANFDFQAIASDPSAMEQFIASPLWRKMGLYYIIIVIIQSMMMPLITMAVARITKNYATGVEVNSREAMLEAFSKGAVLIGGAIISELVIGGGMILFIIPYTSISELLEDFYSQRDNAYHIKQKAHDMRRLVVSNIERCVKKKEIQIKTLKDNEGLEKWKLKGELLTANIYAIEKGMNTIKVINYYQEDMPEIEIALDTTKTPSENAQKYYNKYNKAKRTIVALEVQKKQNDEELEYLEGVLNAIDTSTDEADLNDIRNELIEQGFIKRKRGDKKPAKQQKKSKPLHFISSDGFDIYVGKSNIQNDELTIHFAKSNDIWLHTKNIPGSHVIIATNDAPIVPDQTIIEAANLAAYNSKGKDGSNVPVDYCPRKNVKKPGGSKPGLVIYENNKTVYITPNDVMAENMKKA